LKKTTSFPREAKVADNRVFRLVNESIEAKSLMILQEADETDEDDKVNEEQRGEQLQAFNDMQRLLKNAGFIETATALKRGARVLTNNLAKSGKEASSYFTTAIFMMRSMQTLLRRVAVQAAALNAKQESRNLNDLDALHEALFSKSLWPILLKESNVDADADTEVPTARNDNPADRETQTVAIDPDEGERSMSGRNTDQGNPPPAEDNRTIPPQGKTVFAPGNNNEEGQPGGISPAEDANAGQNQSQSTSQPLLAFKNSSDGRYDEELAKASVQNLISAAFKPDAEFTKWLGKTKISDGIDRRGKALNEGIFDWFKRTFGGSAPTASTVIKAMRPLVGGQNLAELLQNDLLSPLAPSTAAERIAAIKTAQNSIALAIPRITGGNSPPPPPVPAAPAGAGGSSTSGGSTPSPSSAPTDVRTASRESTPSPSSAPTDVRTASRESTPSPSSAPTAAAAAPAAPGGRDTKSIKGVTGVDSSIAGKVLARVRDAKISVTGIGNDLNSGQKKDLANALGDIERDMQKKIDATFTESRKAKGEDLIIERWQRLAGIIK